MEPQANQPLDQQSNQEPSPGYEPNVSPAGPQPQNQWLGQQSAAPAQQPPTPNPSIVIGGMAPQTPGTQPTTGVPQPAMAVGTPKKKPAPLFIIIAAVVLIGGAAAFVLLSGGTQNRSTNNTGSNSSTDSRTTELSSLKGVTFVPGDMSGLTQSGSGSQNGIMSYQSADKNCKLAYGVAPENSPYKGDTPKAILQSVLDPFGAYGATTSAPTQADDLVLTDSSDSSKRYKLETYTSKLTAKDTRSAFYMSSAIFADGSRAIVSVVCGENNATATTTTDTVRDIAKGLKITPQQ